MSQPQYAIMRFAKYKGPEITNIEGHNERRKEKYASNPDIDLTRSKHNFHLIEPPQRYRAEAERQISAAGCRTRKDSVRLVEVLFTATPEFFQGKKLPEIRQYFEEALRFLEQYQAKETIISAVVHMDEKTPHMHLSFVPLTPDGRLSAKEIVGNKKKLTWWHGRLSAKEIVGNKKKLTWWQDKFWEHMVVKYHDLERGESASQTGRDHIPPRIFKEMTRLTKQRQKLDQLLTGIGPLNGKKRAAEISELLDSYIPAVEKMRTQLKKYSTAFTSTKAENEKLKKKNKKLSESLDEATHESVLKQLKDAKLQREYEEALAILERIPPEVLAEYAHPKGPKRENNLDV